jgi:hypothetical protein
MRSELTEFLAFDFFSRFLDSIFFFTNWYHFMPVFRILELYKFFLTGISQIYFLFTILLSNLFSIYDSIKFVKINERIGVNFLYRFCENNIAYHNG